MLVYRRVVAMTIPRFRDFAKESAIRHFEAMGIKCVSPQCQLTFGFCQGLLYVPLRHHCKSLKTMVLMPLVLVIISSLNGTHCKPCVIFFLFLLSTQSNIYFLCLHICSNTYSGSCRRSGLWTFAKRLYKGCFYS